MMETLLRNEDALGNGAESAVLMGAPYSVHVAIEGVADLLFHRWNCEAVDAKAKAAKNSAAKKPTTSRATSTAMLKASCACPASICVRR